MSPRPRAIARVLPDDPLTQRFMMPRHFTAIGVITLLVLGGCQVLRETIFKPNLHQGARIGGLQEGRWKFFYPDGTLKAEGNYRRDEQTGPWTYYHANGKKEWEIRFREATLDGPSTHYFDDESIRARGLFEAGNEQGDWTFWRRADELRASGYYLDGRATGRWTHWYGNDRLKAEGHRLDGQKIGLWRYYDEFGEEFHRDHGLPAGVTIVHEEWPDGMPRREGILRDGVPVGYWATWHASGGRRLAGGFEDGQPNGRWVAWHPDGRAVAMGTMENGAASGEWTIATSGGAQELRPGSSIAPRSSGAGEWSSDEQAGGRDGDELASIWLAELLSEPRTIELQTETKAPAADALVEATNALPKIPIRAQPWRDAEIKKMDLLLSLYDQGAQVSNRRRRGGDPYAGVGSAESRGQLELSEQLVGKPLPVQRVETAEGGIDLTAYRGRKSVVLVVLRGFNGQVCVYCGSQTRALAKNKAEFERRGAEVLVVYPGKEDRLDAFLEGYRLMAEDMEEVPFQIGFDPNFSLVGKLDIEGDLAFPTTVLIDKEGIVRWAYVGKDKVDRPPASRLIEVLDELAQNE